MLKEINDLLIVNLCLGKDSLYLDTFEHGLYNEEICISFFLISVLANTASILILL